MNGCCYLLCTMALCFCIFNVLVFSVQLSIYTSYVWLLQRAYSENVVTLKMFPSMSTYIMYILIFLNEKKRLNRDYHYLWLDAWSLDRDTFVKYVKINYTKLDSLSKSDTGWTMCFYNVVHGVSGGGGSGGEGVFCLVVMVLLILCMEMFVLVLVWMVVIVVLL